MGSRFPIEKYDFFFLAFLFQASTSVKKIHLMEETNHIPDTIFPFPKASRDIPTHGTAPMSK